MNTLEQEVSEIHRINDCGGTVKAVEKLLECQKCRGRKVVYID